MLFWVRPILHTYATHTIHFDLSWFSILSYASCVCVCVCWLFVSYTVKTSIQFTRLESHKSLACASCQCAYCITNTGNKERNWQCHLTLEFFCEISRSSILFILCSRHINCSAIHWLRLIFTVQHKIHRTSALQSLLHFFAASVKVFTWTKQKFLIIHRIRATCKIKQQTTSSSVVDIVSTCSDT